MPRQFDFDRPLTRREFFSRMAKLTKGTIAAAALGAGYSRWLEPSWLTVERTHLNLPDLPAGFDGLTIAQISDLHFGPNVDPALVELAAGMVMQLRPEMIVITGDFVSRLSHGESGLILSTLSRLKAEHGVFGILGNHDWWTDPRVVSESAEKAGINVLRNRNVLLERGGEQLFLAGVDDVWEKKADLSRALEGVPENARVLALVHEPDYADTVVQDGRVILQLSGHSHGGQVRLPLIGAPLLPYLGQKYPYGFYQIQNLQLYTNRGIGVLFPGVRFNCRPEITLHTLHRQPAGRPAI